MEPFLSRPRHLALAIIALLTLNACRKAPETAPSAPPVKVSVAKVIEQPINEWDELSGRLEAPESVEVRPRVSGYIDRVAFVEGGLVKKGELLFQIDPRPFEAEVKRLEAELQQARTGLARAAKEAERGERLRASKAISTELADARASAAQEARAALAAIQAQLDNARLDLGFTRVVSPIDGRAGRAEITAGNLVNAGQALLTTVVSTDRVYAYFDADERIFLKYAERARRNGGDARAAAPVYLGLTGENGHPYLGRLDFLDNQVNPRTGTIRGRAVLDNADGRFTPGLYARVRLVGSDTYAATLIQDTAIGTDLGKKFVLVLGADNILSYRTVELGPKLENLRIVRQGLAKGERIVVNGLQRALPGSAVEAQDVPMADADTLAALARQRRALEGDAASRVASRASAVEDGRP
ncbi:efflux RND transporter periplasmic adaptor subunit [Azorhizophilus paspali]|uniref:Efflux RND transporter periplasmic adaptor subunit n=1 Tax=Azorhizophilus paspali TaxID=69963 RepID=A0ABV6SGH5_AZOPA